MPKGEKIDLANESASAVSGVTPSTGRRRPRRWLSWTLTILLLILGSVGLLLRFGGSLLVISDPLPEHCQVAVALAGSPREEAARQAGALRLLQAGRVDYAVLSVPDMTCWGVPLPELGRRYVQNLQPPDLAQRVVLCVVDADVDSTAEEAAALRPCLERRGWRSVVVVTSDYHTRRARMIWRATLAHADPPFRLALRGVPDGEFEPRGWWRRRLWAKTWLLEFTKLVWTSIVGTQTWK